MKKNFCKIKFDILNYIIILVLIFGALLLAISPLGAKNNAGTTSPSAAASSGAFEILEDEYGEYIEFGMWPQTYVGDAANDELNSTYADHGDILDAWYPSPSLASTFLIDNDITLAFSTLARDYNGQTVMGVHVQEVGEFDGRGDSSTVPVYSTGEIMIDFPIQYFYVEPIKWRIVDGDPYDGGLRLIADKILFAGTGLGATAVDENFMPIEEDNFLMKYFSFLSGIFSSTSTSGMFTEEELTMLNEISGQYNSSFAAFLGLATPTDYEALPEQSRGLAADSAIAEGLILMSPNIGQPAYAVASIEMLSEGGGSITEDNLPIWNVEGDNFESTSPVDNSDVLRGFGIRPVIEVNWECPSALGQAIIDDNPSGITYSWRTGQFNISNANGLVFIQNFLADGGSLNSSYVFNITQDIDFEGVTGWEGMGTSSHVFLGNIHGGGHVIENMNNALIATGENVSVTNLTFVNCDIVSSAAATIVGTATGNIELDDITILGGTLEGVQEGVISMAVAGGLIGIANNNSNIEISNVLIDGQTIMDSDVAGYFHGGVIATVGANSVVMVANSAFYQIFEPNTGLAMLASSDATVNISDCSFAAIVPQGGDYAFVADENGELTANLNAQGVVYAAQTEGDNDIIVTAYYPGFHDNLWMGMDGGSNAFDKRPRLKQYLLVSDFAETIDVESYLNGIGYNAM